ncbi:MAG: GGDEF domain-containing protein [Treponema sp.]|nr:GGDEF domain-containing protein [Treponema sp.]
MHEAPFYYIEANLVCLLIFAFILVKNIASVDRQERQRCFDQVLILHILYFLFDSLWMLLYSGTIQTGSGVLPNLVDAILFSIGAFGAYYWYLYLEIMLEADFVKSSRARLLRASPAIATMLLAIIGFIMKFNYWGMEQDGIHTTGMYGLMIVMPLLYVLAATAKAFIGAFRKENAPRRGLYISAGIYPLAIMLSAVMQVFNLYVPIICCGCTLAMIYVYVNSLDNLISQDPLTQLNNRSELKRFLLNMRHHPETGIYLMMIDVDKFKGINDRFGHLEGDAALRCVADSLRWACTKCSKRHFIARYGGDEFTVAAIADDEQEVKDLCSLINDTVAEKNRERGAAYELRLSIGYARLGKEEDAVRNCLAAADEALYRQKKARR